MGLRLGGGGKHRAMLFVMADRDVLLQCVPKGGRVAELGVYTGEHAALMLETVRCEELHLVDYWQYQPREHIPFPDTPAHFEALERVTRQYMGPDPNVTLERCYQQAVERFAGDPRVTIHRERTAEAVAGFADGWFDLIYVDANHQYEYVLRDLLEYAPKLKPGGLMILNDHYDSAEGRDQNLGIVGAAAAFTKRSHFDYIALTSAPWSDLAITDDPDSPYCQEFVDNLLGSNVSMVELPDSIVPNFQHKVVAARNGTVRHLPSF
jgi:Methyltransferase domain